MTDQKKAWEKPLLVVLGKGRPEENILLGCKTNILTGQMGGNAFCRNNGGHICSEITGS